MTLIYTFIYIRGITRTFIHINLHVYLQLWRRHGNDCHSSSIKVLISECCLTVHPLISLISLLSGFVLSFTCFLSLTRRKWGSFYVKIHLFSFSWVPSFNLCLVEIYDSDRHWSSKQCSRLWREVGKRHDCKLIRESTHGKYLLGFLNKKLTRR